MMKKKKRTGIAIFFIILLTCCAVFFVLISKGIIKLPVDKKKTNEVNNEKKAKDGSYEPIVEKKDIDVLYNGESLKEDKNFGVHNLKGKNTDIRYIYPECALSVDGKSIDKPDVELTFLAIMGDYIVIGIKGNNYSFEVYDENLKLVEKLGNSFGLSDQPTESTKMTEDTNNIFYYMCEDDKTSSTSLRLDKYSLKINGSKIEKKIIESKKDINCSK